MVDLPGEGDNAGRARQHRTLEELCKALREAPRRRLSDVVLVGVATIIVVMIFLPLVMGQTLDVQKLNLRYITVSSSYTDGMLTVSMASGTVYHRRSLVLVCIH